MHPDGVGVSILKAIFAKKYKFLLLLAIYDMSLSLYL